MLKKVVDKEIRDIEELKMLMNKNPKSCLRFYVRSFINPKAISLGLIVKNELSQLVRFLIKNVDLGAFLTLPDKISNAIDASDPEPHHHFSLLTDSDTELVEILRRPIIFIISHGARNQPEDQIDFRVCKAPSLKKPQ